MVAEIEVAAALFYLLEPSVISKIEGSVVLLREMRTNVPFPHRRSTGTD